MQTDENELIARSLRSDATAYGELVERYKNALYRHCFALARDEATAEDIVQDTFIAAYYKLHTFDTTRRFSTWLFKIATNKALTHLKRNARTVTTDDDRFDRFASTAPRPDEAAQNSEIHQAVNCLAPKYQAVIAMHYWEGMAYDEIATVMGVPEGSVKGWLHRAKKQLRKELS